MHGYAVAQIQGGESGRQGEVTLAGEAVADDSHVGEVAEEKKKKNKVEHSVGGRERRGSGARAQARRDADDGEKPHTRGAEKRARGKAPPRADRPRSEAGSGPERAPAREGRGAGGGRGVERSDQQRQGRAPGKEIARASSTIAASNGKTSDAKGGAMSWLVVAVVVMAVVAFFALLR